MSISDKDAVDAGQLTGAEEPTRREILRAVGKYTAALAGTSTVILSAEEVLAAPKNCSRVGGPGRGNGPPPGRPPGC